MYKNFKTIDDLDVRGKKILLWADLNSEIINKKPVISSRIMEHAKTILELKRKKAKIIIISHQSRPGKSDFTSLREHSKLLNKFVKVEFVSDTIGKKAELAIDNLKDGQAILLENIRFLKEEYKLSKKNKILIFFKEKIEIYINDAFSMCHRKETSVVLLPKLFDRAIGRVFEKELKNIEKVKVSKNTLFILGGNKVEDIMLLINQKRILPTGVLALLVVKANGYNIGSKENKILEKESKFVPGIKRNLKNIKMPVDLAFSINGKRKDVSVSKFPVNHKILDIGRQTIEIYEKEIARARRIFWKGTAGDCSYKDFCLGTKRLLKAMEKSKAHCVIAGGHSITAIERYKINKKKLGYVSLSGGALVHYIAGKKLPGLEVLRVKR